MSETVAQQITFSRTTRYVNGIANGEIAHGSISAIPGELLEAVGHIADPEAVLVLTDQVRMAEAVLVRHPEATVDVLAFAIAEVGSFVALKARYRDRVAIRYVAPTWAACDASTVRDIVGKKKRYAAILIDVPTDKEMAALTKALADLSKALTDTSGCVIGSHANSAATLSLVFQETTAVGPFTVASSRKPRVCLPKACKELAEDDRRELAYMRYTMREIPAYKGGMTLEDVPEVLKL